jgi:hypothetical protein
MDAAAIERLLDSQSHILGLPNVVSLDYGEKVTAGERTGAPALVVGVVEKYPADQIPETVPAVPPSVEFEGRELATDVVEEGEITALVLPAPGGTMIQTAGLNGKGSLGVNIQYQGAYRALSCAHVMTAFDPAYVGQPLSYEDDNYDWHPLGISVTAAVPVTHYNTEHVANPVLNVQDLAWADTTPQIGSPAITQIGVPAGIRAAQVGDGVRVYGGMSRQLEGSRVVSTTARFGMKSPYSDGTTVYSFWQSAVKLDASQMALLPGDSGSAVVATQDQNVVGIAFCISTLYIYACRL